MSQQQQQSKGVKMAPKRIPDPTAKSVAGEMKVNKVFGTPLKKGINKKSSLGSISKKMSKMPMKKMSKKMKTSTPSFAKVQKSVAKTMGH